MTALGLLTAMLVTLTAPKAEPASVSVSIAAVELDPQDASTSRPTVAELRDPFAERHPRPPSFHHPDLIDPFGPQKLPTATRGQDRPLAGLTDPFDGVDARRAQAPDPTLVDPFGPG